MHGANGDTASYKRTYVVLAPSVMAAKTPSSTVLNWLEESMQNTEREAVVMGTWNERPSAQIFGHDHGLTSRSSR